ncbi:zinc finger domain-containing protein [Prosthecobacter sp.]|uniref:zinc finger domain-containing protein n=1 Tax=Prosthecobacter sp. TaxID=1965333 RepID=UPI002AB884A2|nr:zinc finger domain-containing protein [Prosthecobacter sp.]MDZ4406221.1 zinc finger domain-containing protein [Prosthecobacter sp.]
MPAPAAILDLVARFGEHIDAYKSGSYHEKQLRTDYIDPLFEALGWDMNNKQGYAEAYRDVIHEDQVKVGGVVKAKARQKKKIGSNLETTVALTLPAEGFTHSVFSDPATLHEFLILSDLQITRGTDLTAAVTESSHHKCARCWKHLSDIGTHDAHPTLCGRCVEAVG